MCKLYTSDTRKILMSKPWQSPSASTDVSSSQAMSLPLNSSYNSSLLPGTHSVPFNSYSYGGFSGGYGGGFNGFPGGFSADVPHLWSGLLGGAAEHLGRFNNFLSMSGAFIENLSSHGRLLIVKGAELHAFGLFLSDFLDRRRPSWREELGLVASSEIPEDERNRHLVRRRVRVLGVASLLFILSLIFRKRRSRINYSNFDQIFHSLSIP